MPEVLTIIYLTYIFITLYFLFLYFLIYMPNRKKFFIYPRITKQYSLDIIVPCYNKEKNIGATIQALLDSNYKGLRKIIVVDDCSTDGSSDIIKNFSEEHAKVIMVKTPKNTGNAAGAKNYGAKFSDSELIGFVDGDSFPKEDSIRKMIGFFDNKKIAAVTGAIMVKERNKFIEKLQAIEYKIIVFTRKLLSFVEAVYVTPGPLAIYRKSAFDEVGGFDETNLTEDIEIVWNLISRGYMADMSNLSKVYTISPHNFKDWFNQRIRWNFGGLQTIQKHRKAFLKKGMLGNFILPFFVSVWILSIFGLSVVFYRVFRRLIFYFLSSVYSVQTQVAILTFKEVNLTPNVLTFFGIAILVSSLFFTLLALSYSKEKDFKKQGLLSIFTYTMVYLLFYPIILLTSMYKFLRGHYRW